MYTVFANRKGQPSTVKLQLIATAQGAADLADALVRAGLDTAEVLRERPGHEHQGDCIYVAGQRQSWHPPVNPPWLAQRHPCHTCMIVPRSRQEYAR